MGFQKLGDKPMTEDLTTEGSSAKNGPEVKPREIEEQQLLEMTFQAQGETVRVRVETLERTGESQPDGWMFKIHEVVVDGEDRTDEWLEKAFDGEKIRGAPFDVLEQQFDKIVQYGKTADFGETVTLEF